MKTKKLSLSADEVALILSLLEHPDLGRQTLSLTYGELPQSIVEHKLVTASHSLLAHNYVTFRNETEIILQSEIKQIFSPVLEFNNVIQFTSHNDETGLVITNIYINTQHKFTAHNITNGVIYNYQYGVASGIPDLIAQWVNLPNTQSNGYEKLLRQLNISMKMVEFVGLVDLPFAGKVNMLSEYGVDNVLARQLAEDISETSRRGSIVQTGIEPDNIENYDFDRASAGLLYVIGQNHAWFLSLEETNENAVGNLISGNLDNLSDKIHSMLL